MIAFASPLPSVIWTNQRLIPLSEGWLSTSIQESAQKAGYHHWELSSSIARAIAHYLEEECSATIVSTSMLEGLLRRSLYSIGYQEIAALSKMSPPHISIDLPQLAYQNRYEIIFFPALGQCLQEALTYEIRGIRLVGLKDCAKILYAARRWKMACEQLSKQIIFFSHAWMEKQRRVSIDLIVS